MADESGYMSYRGQSPSAVVENLVEQEEESVFEETRDQMLGQPVTPIDTQRVSQSLTEGEGVATQGVGQRERIRMMADATRRRQYMEFGTEELSPGNYLSVDLQHDWAQEKRVVWCLDIP